MLGWWVETSHFIAAAPLQRMADADSKYCLQALELHPVTNFILGWWVGASHFIVAAPGNLSSSPRYCKLAHWKARVGIGWRWTIKGMQRDGRCWQQVLLGSLGTQSHHQFHVGLMGWDQPFYSGCTFAKDGRCRQQVLLASPRTPSGHQFHIGLMGWGQPFYSGCAWKSFK